MIDPKYLLSKVSAKDLKNKTVLLRLDWNAPLRRDKVSDPFRVDSSLPTIAWLLGSGARVIVVSHIGEDGSQSLEPVVAYVNKKPLPARNFVEKLFPKKFRAFLVRDFHEAKRLKSHNSFIVLENVRRFSGEKSNDAEFAKELAGLADMYVNDAFSVSHREHASIALVPQFLPSYIGPLMELEIANLSKVLEPEHPFVFILGGVKFSTKVPLLERFAGKSDQIFIGGALANTFLKARGYEVGRSKVDDDGESVKLFLSRENIILPVDVVVDRGGKKVIVSVSGVRSEDKIMDIGPESTKAIEQAVKQAKLVLWNGPLGYTEDGYKKSTLVVSKAISASSAFSVIGGGDTSAALSGSGATFSFVSTGGGAMLEYLAKGKLAGLSSIVGSGRFRK